MALGVAAVAAPSNRGRASNRGEGGVDGGSIDDEEPGGCSSVFNDGGGPVVARADFFFEDDVPSDRPFPCLLAAPTGEEIPSSLLRAGAPSDFLLACVFDFAFDFAFNFTSPPPPTLPPTLPPPLLRSQSFKYVGMEITWVGEGVEEYGHIKDDPENVVVKVDPRYFRPTEVELLLVRKKNGAEYYSAAWLFAEMFFHWSNIF